MRRAEVFQATGGWGMTFLLDASRLPAGVADAFGTPEAMLLSTEADAWTYGERCARLLLANDARALPVEPALGFILYGHAMSVERRELQRVDARQ